MAESQTGSMPAMYEIHVSALTIDANDTQVRSTMLRFCAQKCLTYIQSFSLKDWKGGRLPTLRSGSIRIHLSKGASSLKNISEFYFYLNLYI